MSANTNTISNTVVETVVETKAPRVKKPTLSAKYSKFLVFGYGLVQSLQAQGVLTDEGVEAAYGELKLLSSVEDQTQFYESVLDQSKETSKVMRKYVSQRLAPPKAPRARKPRAKKEATVDATKEKTEKKSVARTKKAVRVESDTSNDIVAELVDAANAEPVVSAEEKKEAKEAEKKAKAEAKEAKEAEKKAKAEAKEAEKKAKEAEKKAKAEAKEKAKVDAKAAKEAEKKAKVEAKVEPPVAAAASTEDDEEEGEEIHTQEIDINGKTYLIDNENNLYSCVTHDEIGKYDANAKSIIAIAP
jgi:hypothetical protein